MAKGLRYSLDQSQPETKLPTATLVLLLDELLGLWDAKNPHAAKTAEAHERFIDSRSAAIDTAMKNRDS